MANTELKTIIENERANFIAVQSDVSMNFEREAKFALQLLETNSYLAGIAMNNQLSLKASINNVSAIGISLNPAAKLAYLVPRSKAVCLDISYMGLLHIAQDSGAILWGQARIVRKNDEFELNGIDEEPTHKFKAFATDAERGEIEGVYVTIKTKEGDYLTHTMTIAKVNAIRDRSESYKAYKSDSSKKTPWVTDAEEMIKKTCVKQAAKYFPVRTERLNNAIDYMDKIDPINFEEKTEVELTEEQEAIYLKLKDAALDGVQPLQTAFGAIKKSSKATDFNLVWTKHGEALKDGAKLAETTVIKHE